MIALSILKGCYLPQVIDLMLFPYPIIDGFAIIRALVIKLKLMKIHPQPTTHKAQIAPFNKEGRSIVKVYGNSSYHIAAIIKLD